MPTALEKLIQQSRGNSEPVATPTPAAGSTALSRLIDQSRLSGAGSLRSLGPTRNQQIEQQAIASRPTSSGAPLAPTAFSKPVSNQPFLKGASISAPETQKFGVKGISLNAPGSGQPIVGVDLKDGGPRIETNDQSNWFQKTIAAGVNTIAGAGTNVVNRLGEAFDMAILSSPNAQKAVAVSQAKGESVLLPEARKRIEAGKSATPTGAEKIAAGLNVASAGMGAAFATQSAELAAAEELPVVGRGLNIPGSEYGLNFHTINKGFELLGEASSFGGETALNAIPISEESKSVLREPVREIAASVGMLFGLKYGHKVLGKGTEVGLEKVGLKPETAAKVSGAVETGTGAAMAPFSTAYKAIVRGVSEGVNKRKSAGIEVTPEIAKQIVNETVKKVEIPEDQGVMNIPTPDGVVDVHTNQKTVLKNFIKGREDITYKVVDTLGNDTNGNPIASRFEWDFKTQQGTIITTNKATAVNIAHEVGHYIDRTVGATISARLSDVLPDYVANRELINKSLSEYALEKLGGNATSAEINSEIVKIVDNMRSEIQVLSARESRKSLSEQFATAFGETVTNPKARETAPEMAQFADFTIGKENFKPAKAEVTGEPGSTQEKASTMSALEKARQGQVRETVKSNEDFKNQVVAEEAKAQALEVKAEIASANYDFKEAVKAIKNSPEFKKEGDITDATINGTIMTKNGRDVLIPREKVKEYAAKGYTVKATMDEIASANGFENAEVYVKYVQELSEEFRSINRSPIQKRAHEYLMKNDPNYAELSNTIDRLREELVSEEAVVRASKPAGGTEAQRVVAEARNPEAKVEPKILFHGTSKGNDFSQFDLAKAQEGNRGKHIYLTENRTAAEYFGKEMEQQAKFKRGEQNPNFENGNVLAFSLSPDAKIQHLDEFPQNRVEGDKLVEKLKSEGFDGVSFPEDLLTKVEGIDIHDAFDKNGNPARTTLIFNPKVLERVKEPAKVDQSGIAPEDIETAYDTPEIVRIRKENENLPPTSDINTPERQALRQKIIEKLYGNGAAKKERIIDIVIGPPAAGKSKIVSDPLVEKRGAILIDSDVAKRELPEYGPRGEYAQRVHKESADIITAGPGGILEKAMRVGDNIVHPIIGKNTESVAKLMDDFKRAGYTVNLIEVDLPANKSTERAQTRFNEGGQFIDPKYTLSLGLTRGVTYDTLQARAGFSAKLSNDVLYGQEPKLIQSNNPTEARDLLGLGADGNGPFGRFGSDTGNGVENGRRVSGESKGKTTDVNTSKTVSNETPPTIAGTGLDTGKRVKNRLSYNPEKINAPEDVDALFKQISESSGEFKQQRISKGDADIENLAREVGITSEQLIKAQPGSIANAETVFAARRLVADMAQEFRDHLRTIDSATATPEQLADVKQRLFRLQGTMKAVAGFRTEAANVFRQFGMEAKAGENDILSEMLTELKKIDKDAGDDLSVFTKKSRELLEPSVLDKGFHLWYASILSGPSTHIKNALGNFAHLATELGRVATTNPKEFQSAIKGTMDGLGKGFTRAKQVWKEGDIGKFEERGQKPIAFAGKLKFLNYADYIGRALSASDAFFRAGFKGMELRSLAREQAIKEGFKGDTLEARIEELYRKPSEEIEAQADTFASRGTYTQKPTGVLGVVASLVGRASAKIPVLKMIVPFTNIVANVTNTGLDWTPAGFYRTAVPKGVTGSLRAHGRGEALNDLTARQRHQGYARAALGTLAMAGFASLAADDKLSGNGPKDSKRRDQLMATGWRPNSIKMGDTWIPYTNLGPLAVPMALASNYVEATKYTDMSEKDIASRASAAVMNSASSLLDASFLSSVSELLAAVENPERNPDFLKRWIVQQATSPVPNLVKQVGRYFDPGTYETNTMLEMAQSSLRITSGLRPKLNVWGEAMKGDALTQLTPHSAVDDKVKTFLADNDLWLSVPSKSTSVKLSKNDSRQMTEDEYYTYIQESGPKIHEKLSQVLPYIESLDPEMRQDYIDSIVSDVRDEVKNEITINAL